MKQVRDPSMDSLRVTIDVENNVISVYNNGKSIPIEIHREENVYGRERRKMLKLDKDLKNT